MCCLWTGGGGPEEGGETVEQFVEFGEIPPVAPARRPLEAQHVGPRIGQQHALGVAASRGLLALAHELAAAFDLLGSRAPRGE